MAMKSLSSEHLSPQEALFVKHLLTGAPGIRFNQVQSMLQVNPSLTYESAAVQADRLLKRAKVRAEIASFTQSQIDETEQGVALTKQIARGRFEDIATWTADSVSLIPQPDMNETGRVLLEAVKCTTTTLYDRQGKKVSTTVVMEPKMRDRDGARRDLLKMANLLKADRLEVSGPNGGPIEVEARVRIELPANGHEVIDVDVIPMKALPPARNGHGQNGKGKKR